MQDISIYIYHEMLLRRTAGDLAGWVASNFTALGSGMFDKSASSKNSSSWPALQSTNGTGKYCTRTWKKQDKKEKEEGTLQHATII